MASSVHSCNVMAKWKPDHATNIYRDQECIAKIKRETHNEQVKSSSRGQHSLDRGTGCCSRLGN